MPTPPSRCASPRVPPASAWEPAALQRLLMRRLASQEELADAKQASADSEEVFQLSMELKKVKQSLASSNYESTMARKMQVRCPPPVL